MVSVTEVNGNFSNHEGRGFKEMGAERGRGMGVGAGIRAEKGLWEAVFPVLTVRGCEPISMHGH